MTGADALVVTFVEIASFTIGYLWARDNAQVNKQLADIDRRFKSSLNSLPDHCAHGCRLVRECAVMDQPAHKPRAESP